MAPNPNTSEQEPLLSVYITSRRSDEKVKTSAAPQGCRRITWGSWANLLIFSIAELLGGFTVSLLSPFYTQEATAKGLTVTQTGLVCSLDILWIFIPEF
jgi:hypothetical protein